MSFHEQFFEALGATNFNGRFSERYRCFPCTFLAPNLRKSLTHSSNILLPPSALMKLGNLNMEFPFFFRLSNQNDGTLFSHCGVLEFTSQEGRVYLPPWLMQSLRVNDGEIICVDNVRLPQGKFVKIEPQNVDFLKIHDPRAVLESAFRNYSTITEGDTISFLYNEKQYDIKLLEVKPQKAVTIIETDLEVDFAPPVGYVEPDYKNALQSQGSSSGISDFLSMRREFLKYIIAPENPDTGVGKRMGTRGRAPKTISSKPAPEPTFEELLADPIPRPMRLPLGHLFFGFPCAAAAAKLEKENRTSLSSTTSSTTAIAAGRSEQGHCETKADPFSGKGSTI